MTRKPSARRSVDQTCALCPSSPPNSWRCRRFIGFAVAWSRIASGSSIRSAVFSRSTASLLQRTSAISGVVGDDEDHVLNPLVRALMAELREEVTELDARIVGYDRKIRELYRNSE